VTTEPLPSLPLGCGPDIPDGRGDVEVLLAGLEVGSISELRQLVETGRSYLTLQDRILDEVLATAGEAQTDELPSGLVEQEVILARVLLRRHIAAAPARPQLVAACRLLDRLERLG
jgi:hypothetical protein